jgi:hypothetical protein
MHMALKIFLNYRREDTKGQALALRQFLSRKLPRAELFMDIDGGIRPSENFLRVLSERVAGSDVFLCLIGDRWLETADAKGNRRLDNADDFVRTEIAAALRSDVLASYHIWCAARGHAPLSMPRLAAELKELGYVKWKSNGLMRYRDLQLVA